MSFAATTLSSADTVVEVVPARGAIVTRLAVAGRELLYLDRATLDDPTKNVRGGIPILVPFAGRLEGDRFDVVGGEPTTMKQHGFGRNLEWQPIEVNRAEVTMRLTDSAATRAQFPYAFRFQYCVSARPRGVVITLEVANTGDVPLPMAPGWHPYFNCPAARKGEVTSDVAGLDPARFTDEREFDFGLPRPQAGAARFQLPELGAVTLTPTAQLRYLQFWSQPGKPFICLEPFFGPPGIINTPQRDVIAPGKSAHYGMSIGLD
jgi:galactose mutarotase-like enzyme